MESYLQYVEYEKPYFDLVMLMSSSFLIGRREDSLQATYEYKTERDIKFNSMFQYFKRGIVWNTRRGFF